EAAGLSSEVALPLGAGVAPETVHPEMGAGSRAGASATAALPAGTAGGSRLVLLFVVNSVLAAGTASPPPKALATDRSADVTSLGMTQNVLPAPCASCGSVCRY